MTRKARHSMPASAEIRSTLVPRELTKQEFGRRLQTLMLAREWNQSELAAAAGLGKDSVSTYINGKTFPTAKALSKLAKALGVTPEELLPNSLKQAMDEEFPAIELKQAAGHPDKVWLRVNRLVSFAAGSKIIALINEDDEKERQGG